MPALVRFLSRIRLKTPLARSLTCFFPAYSIPSERGRTFKNHPVYITVRAAVVKVALKSTKIVHLVPQLLHTVRRASRGIRIGDFILFLSVFSLFLDAVLAFASSLSLSPPASTDLSRS